MANLTNQTKNLTLVLRDEKISIAKWEGVREVQKLDCNFKELTKAVDDLKERANERP